MMCQSIGSPPISIIGFGAASVSSARRVPKPPARITVFIASKLAGGGGPQPRSFGRSLPTETSRVEIGGHAAAGARPDRSQPEVRVERSLEDAPEDRGLPEVVGVDPRQRVQVRTRPGAVEGGRAGGLVGRGD